MTGVKFRSPTYSVPLTKQLTLGVQVLPNNATNKDVTFLSKNPSVLTVKNTGEVTGVALGNAEVVVTTVDGGFTDRCTVTVTDKSACPEWV